MRTLTKSLTERDYNRILKEFRPLLPDSFINPSLNSPVIHGTYITNHLIRMIFFNILKFIDYGFIEKGYWHTYFVYKHKRFTIQDGKFGWSIYAENSKLKDSNIVVEMKKKLLKVIDFLNNDFCKSIQGDKNNPKIEFYLNNPYQKLSSYYSFYRKNVSYVIKDSTISNQKKDNKNASALFKEMNLLRRREDSVSKHCFPLIFSFFSLLDFLILTFFVFEDSNVGFQKIKNFKLRMKRDWSLGFRDVFDLSKPSINRLFLNLKDIREKYRTPLSHGICGDTGFLILFPGLGLIPQSYKDLQNQIYYGFTDFRIKNAKIIMEEFNKFIKFIKSNKPYKFYLVYLESGLAIPINSKGLRLLKNKMKNLNELNKYIDTELHIAEMVDNREMF